MSTNIEPNNGPYFPWKTFNYPKNSKDGFVQNARTGELHPVIYNAYANKAKTKFYVERDVYMEPGKKFGTLLSCPQEISEIEMYKEIKTLRLKEIKNAVHKV